MNNLLKEILESLGFTQTELSLASGVSLTTINKVCNQRREVSKTTESKILRGLNQLAGKEFKREEIFPKSN